MRTLLAFSSLNIDGEDGQRLELKEVPEKALSAARKAFRLASAQRKQREDEHGAMLLARLAGQEIALDCQAVVYGPKGRMEPHLDASVGRRPKNVAILSFGDPCIFIADGNTFTLPPGSALVFDAANVMHGVDRILPCASSAHRGARISLIFFEKFKLPCTSELNRTEDDFFSAAPSLLFSEEEGHY